MPDLAPPMAGPLTLNLTSMVLASDSTSRRSRPLRMRVPPPAAPPRSELMTTQPRAGVSASCHSKTISGALFSKRVSSSFTGVFRNSGGVGSGQQQLVVVELLAAGLFEHVQQVLDTHAFALGALDVEDHAALVQHHGAGTVVERLAQAVAAPH